MCNIYSSICHIFGIGVSSGTARPLINAIGTGHPAMRDEEQRWITDPARSTAIDALLQDGFRDFVEADGDLATLATEAMTRSLAEAACEPGQIDAVMFITESFWEKPAANGIAADDRLGMRNELVGSLGALGLNNASIYGNWLSASANLGTSIVLGRALLAAERHERMMLVAVDKLPASTPRLMKSEATVFSDVATSCVLAREPRGYLVRHVVSVSAPRVVTFGEDTGKIVFETLKALKTLADKFTQAAGRPAGDFEMVIAGHFHTLSLQLITDALRIPGRNLRRDARAQFGHAFSSDNLLTLQRLEEDGQLRPGQELLLLNTGLWTWSIVLLERCQDR
jgi:3-oxoacyl-[acyl-carrier-protein] synthase III